MNAKIRIVIVDDHPLFREGLVYTLSNEPDFEIVGQGATADEAIRLASSLQPDALLLDIGIPGGGLIAAQAIAAARPLTRIVMLTASTEEDDLVEALKAGARGYILKGVSARELVSIVRSVLAGEGYVAPALAAGVLSELSGGPSIARASSGALDELTEREREVLEQVASGRSNKEIGHALHLSEKTIKHYMTNILQKLRVRNRVEATLVARRVGAIKSATHFQPSPLR